MNETVDLLVLAVNALASLFGAPSFQKDRLLGVTLSGLYSMMLAVMAKDGTKYQKPGLSWCYSDRGFYFAIDEKDGQTTVRIHSGTSSIDVEMYAKTKKSPHTLAQLLNVSWAMDYGYVQNSTIADKTLFTAKALTTQRRRLTDIVTRVDRMRTALQSEDPEETRIRDFIGMDLGQLKLAS